MAADTPCVTITLLWWKLLKEQVQQTRTIYFGSRFHSSVQDCLTTYFSAVHDSCKCFGENRKLRESEIGQQQGQVLTKDIALVNYLLQLCLTFKLPSISQHNSSIWGTSSPLWGFDETKPAFLVVLQENPPEFTKGCMQTAQM